MPLGNCTLPVVRVRGSWTGCRRTVNSVSRYHPKPIPRVTSLIAYSRPNGPLGKLLTLGSAATLEFLLTGRLNQRRPDLRFMHLRLNPFHWHPFMDIYLSYEPLIAPMSPCHHAPHRVTPTWLNEQVGCSGLLSCFPCYSLHSLPRVNLKRRR